jgi:NADPH2:quinone reductase
VFDAILAGSLRITIGGRYPLADAVQAHRDLQGRHTTGKLLLLP